MAARVPYFQVVILRDVQGFDVKTYPYLRMAMTHLVNASNGHQFVFGAVYDNNGDIMERRPEKK